MSINERRKYLQVIQSRYRRASRPGKSSLLDEAELVTKLKRKSLIRLLNGDLERKERKRQRGRTYGIQVQRALMVLSESTDHICPERLQPNLVWLAKHLTNHGELEVTPKLLEQLGQISVSTVRRIIRRTQQDQPRLPRPRPKPRNEVARQIPVKRISWDEREPGHFEVDLVHHSGSTAGGHYVHSLQMIDVATGWSERVATLGRSYLVIKDGFERILDRLPFPVLEIHSDNGSEFLNHHLIRFWEEEKKVTTLTRGRPHQKNDQRFVEQKNSTLIRQFFGYERFDTVAHTVFLNLLYRKMWLFYNFFQPVMRLVEKRMVDQKNGEQRLRRRHDLARTPYERLCETKKLTSKRQQELDALREQTNPRQLRQEIYQMLDTLFSLPTATEDKTEDVYQTLRAVTGTEIEEGCGYVENSPQAPSSPHIHSLYCCHSEGRNTTGISTKLKESPVTLTND